MARIRDVDHHLENEPMNQALLKKYGYIFASAINSLRASRTTPVENGVQLCEVKEFGPEFDGFYEDARKDYLWIMWRDQQYLNWRYSDPRGGMFRAVKAVDEDGSILGYVVSRVDRVTDYPRGYIVDWLTAPGRMDVLSLLLEKALEYFDEQGVNISVALAVKGSSAYRVLRDVGFVDSRQENYLFYNIFDESPELMEKNARLQSSEPNQLHFTYGDTDWI
jgi:hypothetical protein